MLQNIILRDPVLAKWLVFSTPSDVLLAHRPDEVLSVLREIERMVNEEDLFAAGFVTYEAAPGFDPALQTHAPRQLPLLCFGLFRQPDFTDRLPAANNMAPESIDWKMTESRRDYSRKIQSIKCQMEQGNTYQINYTVQQFAENIDNGWALFQRMADDAPYAAYVECEDHTIISASPELFFRLSDGQLACKPMKGTARRGLTSKDDARLRQALEDSPKERAENLMILDMVRNDIGRIAAYGSVEASGLFKVEKYDTVWQMTSSVSASTDTAVTDIFQALFPCASITGAPKVESMKIIKGLEKQPREIYTGAIGYIGPGRKAQFSVAIRTALINNKTRKAVYGVGGGIVWDSDPEEEYKECLAKASVLTYSKPPGNFDLFETMLWTPEEGYFLLEEHLERLYSSAEYFDFSCDQAAVRDALNCPGDQLTGSPHRVRLSIRRDGALQVSHWPLPEKPVTPQQVSLATEPVDSQNVFLYHKTTRRDVYKKALQTVPTGNDVLLWNTEGYITETSIANVAVTLDGQLYTPPVECGLLEGTYRSWLIGKGEIKERKIHKSELILGKEITLFNSVRGIYTALHQQ